MEHAEFPIMDGGRAVGTLQLRQDGLYTVLTAAAENTGCLTRLYLSGGGETVCLGVMTPIDGRLTLTRRLTKLELKPLPKRIELVSLRPPEQRQVPAPAPGPDAEPQPASAAPLWKVCPDGSLIRCDGSGTLIALPASLRRFPPGLRLMRINGREYLVFRY